MFFKCKFLFSGLLLIQLFLVNINPKKAFAQELNCKYGHWINPNTGINECFGTSISPNTSANTTKTISSPQSSIANSIDDLGESIVDLAILCDEIKFNDLATKCLYHLKTSLQNYEEQCTKSSKFDNTVSDICRKKIIKVIAILDE